MSVPTRPPDPHGRHSPPRDGRPARPRSRGRRRSLPASHYRRGGVGRRGRPPAGEAPGDDPRDALGPPRSRGPRLTGRGRRPASAAEPPAPSLTAEQRLLLLDTWRRSGLPAGDFAPLVGLSRHTLYEWKRRFEAEGPAGLKDKQRGVAARQPPARGHQAHHPDDQAGQSRLGLRADQRPVDARPGPARQPGRPSPASCTRPAIRLEEAPTRPHPPTRSTTSSAPGPTSCGRPTCSPSC